MQQAEAKRIIHQFQHASVIYTEEHSAATDKVMPKLEVMCIDAYRYQRELTVQYRHEPGDSKNLYWEFHVYRHPGRRALGKVPEKVAKKFISRFLEFCEKCPALLFNKTGEHTTNVARPNSEGFVHLCERIHDSETISVDMLD